MGYIRKRGDGWRAEVYKRGIRESETFPTRQEAVDWAAQREDEILRGMGGTSNRSWGKLVDKYLQAFPPVDKFDRVRKNALYGLPFAGKVVSAIQASDLSSWRDLRLAKVAPGTVAREMTVIRGAFEYARRDLGWIRVNPIADVQAPKEPPARRRIIAADEQTAILNALGWAGKVETIRHEVAAAFLLALETGMRAGEIVDLTWTRIHDDHLSLLKTKNGDRRQVPLNAKARDILAALKSKRLHGIKSAVDKSRVFHITAASRDQTFRRACAKAGVVDVHFHDARATAITRFAKVLSPLELARMIGHRDLNSLMWYYAESASSIAAKLDAIPASQERRIPANGEPRQDGTGPESPDAS